MGFDDGLDDGQAETDTVLATARCGWSAVIRFEQPLGLFDRYSGPSIGDGHPNGVATNSDRNVDRSIGGAKLTCVQNQIDQHLTESAAVSKNLRRSCREPHPQA